LLPDAERKRPGCRTPSHSVSIFFDLELKHLHRPENLQVLAPSLDYEVALPRTDSSDAATSDRRT
jgi:hypothetical protein